MSGTEWKWTEILAVITGLSFGGLFWLLTIRDIYRRLRGFWRQPTSNNTSNALSVEVGNGRCHDYCYNEPKPVPVGLIENRKHSISEKPHGNANPYHYSLIPSFLRTHIKRSIYWLSTKCKQNP